MGSPLHIGYMIQDFPPEVGAGPARVSEMAKLWQKQGATVTAMVAMPNRRLPGRGEGSVDPRYRGKLFMEENWDGIRTLRSWLYTGNGRGLATKTLNNASFMLSSFLHAVARRDKFDVLIASSPPFLPQVSAATLSKMRGIPLVLELRDLWPDYMVQLGMLKNRPVRAGLFALERRLLNEADHVVVVTESFRKRVVDKGVRPDRIDVIPNGVDVTDYHSSNEQPPFAALNKAAGEFIVGYLGTFGKGQGLEYVIRAAELVGRKENRIRFVLTGDGPELPRVKQEIEKLGLSNVALHPPIPRNETRAFYNACDVCLVPLAPVPIFSETIPSKIFEIMACERPLIASVAGEGAAIVERSGGGLRTDPGDAEGLANAILSVRAMSAGDREAMGQRARRFVAAHYDRVALADKYFEILKMVAERGRKSRGVELSS